MKYISLILIIVCTAATVACAQDVTFPAEDSSPADVVYFPLNSAKQKDMSQKPVIRVLYSRPHKKGRDIFGVLEQYGKVWRTGANESTEIKFYKPVIVGGKNIPAGTYSLFTIPQKDSWTMIINRQTDKWGAFMYDENQDIVRVKVPVKKQEAVIETFSITFAPVTGGANLVLGWDHTVAALPIKF